jgi:hypothetical protein
MKEHFPEHFAFVPQTFVLPQEQDAFDANFDKQKTYIVKPSVGSEGNGIYLLQKKKELRREQKECVVQEYVANPMLMDGFKFDLRLYVLVCSFDPLRVYICREGLVRLATVPYQKPTQQNAAQSYMHLTNATLNKRNTGAYEHGDEGGSKRLLSELFGLLQELGFDSDDVWASITALVAMTMLALQPAAANEYKNSYPDADPSKPKTTVRRFQVKFGQYVDKHIRRERNGICSCVVSRSSLHLISYFWLLIPLFLRLSFPPSL